MLGFDPRGKKLPPSLKHVKITQQTVSVTSFAQGEWEKEKLEFHTALRRRCVSYLRLSTGSLPRNGNSEINGSAQEQWLLGPGENMQ